MKNLFILAAGALSLLFAVQIASVAAESAPAISIVPQPVSVKQTGGVFTLKADTVIAASGNARITGEFLADILRPPTGFALPVKDAPEKAGLKGAITIKIDSTLSAKLGDEGYRLAVTPDSVLIAAPTDAGAFYGAQSLRQLFPLAIESRTKTDAKWEAPCVEIEDFPRFKWRGLMLDVGRHFQPKEFVLKYIDTMSMFKMNRFHFHLTEDQGWRIEIKKYPELTKIGAWREKSKASDAFNNPAGKAHGGFFTQDEIREIVAYAAARHITVVPEIEMPGHSQAALASINELSCTGQKLKVLNRWGVNKEVYCAGNEKVFEFLQNVLAEVAELFPGEYIHIGGDEVPKDRWKECPKCQARIKAEGLKDEAELQSYFVKRIEKYLDSIGKKLIGWDEILEGGLPPRATVMSWRGIEGGIAAAKEGHDVIMSPTSHCYIDYMQSFEKEPNPVGRPISLCKIYSFEPIPAELDESNSKHILGAQANLWTEHIEKQEHAMYMTYPRAVAIAEVGWTKKELKDFKNFKTRMSAIYPRLDALGVAYRAPRDKDDMYCEKQ